jgi:tetratricopeptide (TPR) repeat protein
LSLRRHGILLLLACLLLLPLPVAAQSASGTQTVLVFPFDNSTHRPDLEWISEAFPEVLGQRLNTESLYLISRDDRRYAYDRMGIPMNLHLSRATLYRIASELDADFVVMGSYGYDGQDFTATAQVLDMKALRLSPDLVEKGTLDQFVAIQNALAWDVLRSMRPDFAESKADFLRTAPVIRLNAFENYIRGVLASDSAEKIRYFRAAIATDPRYTQAILLLGRAYYNDQEYMQASPWLAQVPSADPSFAEASFLLGVSEYHLGHFDKASAAFKATAARVPLTEVINDVGVAESRRPHQDSTSFFQKAVDADPSDADYHFNLALALYRSGDAAGSQRQLREALTRDPSDQQSRTLLQAISAGPVASLPPLRLKINYDESSYRQLSVELQNAIDASIHKADPSEQAALHLERARDLLATGAAAEAENQFREAFELQPQNPEALAGLAHALVNQMKFAEARLRATAALAIKPGAEAYLVLARADLHDHNRTAARQNLQKAEGLEPQSADAKAVEQELSKQESEEAASH